LTTACGEIAQPVEQRPEKPCVPSSILGLATSQYSALFERFFYLGAKKSMQSMTLRNLRFPVDAGYDLKKEVSRKLRLPQDSFQIGRIMRKAVDTRRKNLPYYDFTLQISLEDHAFRHQDLLPIPFEQVIEPQSIPTSDPHPYIIGMGPSGLFCALAMVQNGLQPWLFDRGDALEGRAERVGDFWVNGMLDEESNVQFGEGGAGAFSDGKLTSRANDPAVQQILQEMIRFGAPESIAYDALPHLGTDGIRALVSALRLYLQEHGCRFFYRHKLEEIQVDSGRISQVRINGEWHQPELIVLALGNAARETFSMLSRQGIELQAKPFALGVRIEQSQKMIDGIVFGDDKWNQILGPATYRLAAPTGYTFCMCPGGQVIASSSEQGTIVTNGMSYNARNAEFCNSAIVTPVSQSDFGAGLWDGMAFQYAIESQAYREGYLAPAQTCSGFLAGTADPAGVITTYRPGTYPAELNTLFSQEVSDRLKAALKRFDDILPGFLQDAALIAPETRTSSPIRILRDSQNLCSVSAANLYPIGEGSGYAGGIVSSARDGWLLGQRLSPNK
jgi:uncharacterized protein